MPLKLTERAVKAIEPPETGSITIWDSEITGFGVRVFAPTSRRPQGARSFFMNYWIEGRERRITIGAIRNGPLKPREVMPRSCAAASIAAKIRRASGASGVKRLPSADLAERYRTEHLPKKAESSRVNDWQMIENEILPRAWIAQGRGCSPR